MVAIKVKVKQKTNLWQAISSFWDKVLDAQHQQRLLDAKQNNFNI